MEESVERKITSTPTSDLVKDERDDSERWKPKNGGSVLLVELPTNPTPDIVELTPQSEEGTQTTPQPGEGGATEQPTKAEKGKPTTAQPQEGKQTPQNLDEFRFTVEFKKKGSPTFEPYLPTDGTQQPKVSSNSLL